MSLDFYTDSGELGVNTFASYLEQDALSQPNPVFDMELENAVDTEWLDHFLDDPILNDKMMSDALQPQPHVQSEHSYSLTNGEKRPVSPLSENDTKDIDFEQDFLAAVNPNMTVFHKSNDNGQTTKKEAVADFEQMDMSYDQTKVKEETNVTKNNPKIEQPTIILASQYSFQPTKVVRENRLVLPQINIKVEPADAASISSSPEQTAMFDRIGLPPTPPSSSSSDSEGGQSPHQSAPSSPQRQHSMTRQQAIRSVSQQLFTSPIPTSGVLLLTEEEKRTLISEGYPVPTKLPLSKQEEKNLKKIRRKIKNKISAQESRRKKKEYLETLEKKVESFNIENIDLKKKVDQLENNNRSLMSQLHKLQALAGKLTMPTSPASQTGTCLMVLVVFFAVFLGAWSPISLNTGYINGESSVGAASKLSAMVCQSPSVHAIGPKIQEVTVDAYSTPNVRSRVLLSEPFREGADECEHYGPHPPFSYKDMLVNWLISKPEIESVSEDLFMEPPHPLVSASDSQAHVDYADMKPIEPKAMHPGPSPMDNMTALVTTANNAINATA